jgi:hypothetical protein
MKISEELQTLIEATLADGKISKKEKKVLFNKAEKECLDLDEFEVYLDSLRDQVKSNASGQKESKISAFGKWLVQKKRRVIIASLILIYAISGLVMLVGGLYTASERENLADERGCADVDDCIAQYKFREARQYASGRAYKLRKIISAEVTYFMDNDAEKRALGTIKEYNFEESPDLSLTLYNNQYYNEEVFWYNNQLKKILVDSERQKEDLRKVLALFKEKVVEKDGKVVLDDIRKNKVKEDLGL